MSLSFLRDAITKALQERVDAATNRAINLRVHAESTADGYALIQADALAEARAFATAAQVVVDEYRKMTETAVKPEDAPMAQQQRRENVYG